MEKTEKFLTPDQSYSDVLRISPFAFAKMVFWRNCGDTEVAAYATTKTRDPLFITDFRLIKQECTGITFDLNTDDLAEDVERTLDDGLCPWQTHNILCHSHPGNSPGPSGTDEANFAKAFSRPDWAIMLIIAQDSSTYCRLKLNVGPGIEKLLKVQVDFSQDFPASDHKAWGKEYQSKVTRKKFRMTGKEGTTSLPDADDPLWWDKEHDKHIGFHATQQINDEIDIDCYWDTVGDVAYWNDNKGKWYSYNPVEQKWYTENLDDNESIIEIDEPNYPWAKQVIAWAEKHSDEYMPVVEDLL